MMTNFFSQKHHLSEHIYANLRPIHTSNRRPLQPLQEDLPEMRGIKSL
jgi:hypothetical protein